MGQKVPVSLHVEFFVDEIQRRCVIASVRPLLMLVEASSTKLLVCFAAHPSQENALAFFFPFEDFQCFPTGAWRSRPPRTRRPPRVPSGADGIARSWAVAQEQLENKSDGRGWEGRKGISRLRVFAVAILAEVLTVGH